MIDYDSFSRCHLTDIFFRFSRESKRVNIPKTNFMLIDNYINASRSENFKINSIRNVKYLGMLIDDGLNWEPHIKQLSLQFSKFSAMMFCLRNFVDTETHKLLYYSLIYSLVQYGIILWETTLDKKK